ncbi:hypothetical protein ACF3NV_07720 [Moraxella atlantae]|uniref:hypothetical protein n=1 Tax=Faucicola atlantae TaxID=34059 RepID=UPI0037507C9E
MNDQPNCFYVNEDNEIIETYLSGYYYFGGYYYFIRKSYPLVYYHNIYYSSIYGYSADFNYGHLDKHIPYDKEAIYFFLNQQTELFIHARLLKIL